MLDFYKIYLVLKQKNKDYEKVYVFDYLLSFARTSGNY